MHIGFSDMIILHKRGAASPENPLVGSGFESLSYLAHALPAFPRIPYIARGELALSSKEMMALCASPTAAEPPKQEALS